MGLLCFVLDLPLLPPLLLHDIKRTLLRVANSCAATRFKLPPSSFRIVSLNLAVCCVDRASVSATYELRIIYKSMESLNLREFHHAVNSLLPSSSLGISSSHGQVSSIEALLQLRNGLLSWASEESFKKIIMISSQFFENTGSFRQMLKGAADRCISIDFIQFSLQTTDESFLGDGSHEQCRWDLAENIGEFENCTFQQVSWDVWQLAALEKKWIQDLVSDVEGPLEITLIFKEKLYKDTDKVFCALWPLLVQLTDSIQPCQTCRCHGAVIDSSMTHMTERSHFLCPITGQKLDNHDFTSHGVKVGSHTVLYLPSFMSPVEPAKHFTSPTFSLSFSVLKCILLSTLSEGLLFGDPYILLPSSEVDFDDDTDKLEVNDGVFSSLCEALYSQDCGLLCTSSFDIDMRAEKSFSCYYLLLPADNRSFLARRIAASEEFLQFSLPELKKQNLPLEIRDSVSSCLSKLGVQSYNPLDHERGLHNKLNWLAKESLQLHPMLVQRPEINKAQGNQRAECLDTSSQILPSKVSRAVGLRENDKEKLIGIMNFSGRGRSSQAGGEHQEIQQAAPKVSHATMEGGNTSLGPLSLKPLLPLQMCPKPSNNKVMSPRLGLPAIQKQLGPAKPASEPGLLKTNFRRIKQGRV
ncbi:hypothetical protein GOP47_0000851 [Adiantum capillus-veneris]|uniref:Uncharacterized protein n=1 Tax=Adiantum capillus-veneris TaxID=13818 RepID=A0A9D4ZTB3_ADICA|nr:hypothetical protein GOP47_0000851 [Adiantum capillus-veneris]